MLNEELSGRFSSTKDNPKLEITTIICQSTKKTLSITPDTLSTLRLYERPSSTSISVNVCTLRAIRSERLSSNTITSHVRTSLLRRSTSHEYRKTVSSSTSVIYPANNNGPSRLCKDISNLKYNHPPLSTVVVYNNTGHTYLLTKYRFLSIPTL